MTKSFDTDLEAIGPVRLLRDGSVVCRGKKQLKRYNVDTGTEISCVDIPSVMLWYCLVELGGRSSLALTFG